MLYYDRINLSERTDIAESSNSKQCLICLYCFLNLGFKCQDSLRNGYHDSTMLCLNIRDITVITDKSVDSDCIIHDITINRLGKITKHRHWKK